MVAGSAVGISGAELKVKLQGLGLPPSWFAERVGVTMRTVVRWFDSKDPVSETISEQVKILEEATLSEMRKMLNKAGDGDDIKLRTYRTDEDFAARWPASWHRALTFRVLEHLEAQGKNVEVVYR